MTVYNFILAFLTGCLSIFGLYYLFTVIFIHKKILDKHFYFFMACISFSGYIFFELLLSLEFSDAYYLLFHKLKILSLFLFVPFLQFTITICYLPEGKTYIPKVLLGIVPLFIFLAPLDAFISLPIKHIEVKTFFTTFIYNFGETNIIYTIYISIMMITFIAQPIYFFVSKSKGKRYPFLIIFIIAVISGLNDSIVVRGYIPSIMITEYATFIFVAFVFYDLLKEDRKTYLSVIELKNESERRLRITEIYTRKSLVESIEQGQDPTKFQPQNIQIATLFSDIRDFTGISEGLKPLEVVEMLNAYFNRMNGTIIKHNGEIDKLMGDCIMALYKNPDDALKSAIEMRRELARFNEEQIKEAVIPAQAGIQYLGTTMDARFHEPDKQTEAVISSQTRIQNTASTLDSRFRGNDMNAEALIPPQTGIRNITSTLDSRFRGNDIWKRQINNGIGLNYGEVIIGNIGSESKMDYTVVGDIVNTASRLEALTKYYKTPLIISEDLKIQLQYDYKIRFLDEVLVKGKSNPMKIYEVFDFEPNEIIEIKENNVEAMAEAFNYYQQGKFLKAIEIYEKLRIANYE